MKRPNSTQRVACLIAVVTLVVMVELGYSQTALGCAVRMVTLHSQTALGRALSMLTAHSDSFGLCSENGDFVQSGGFGLCSENGDCTLRQLWVMQ